MLKKIVLPKRKKHIPNYMKPKAATVKLMKEENAAKELAEAP